MKININTIMSSGIAVIAILASTAFAHKASAFEQNFYYYNTSSGMESLVNNPNKIDTLLPQNYELGRNLQLIKVDDRGAVKFAQDNDIKVIPLVHQQNWDRAFMSVILNIPKLQNIYIAQMISEAKRQNFDGWHYDFENIAPGDKDLYSKFVERSSKRFKEEGLEFSVAIIPRQSDYREGIDDPNWSVAYDLEEIAKHVDYVTLMAYDDPMSVGPSASLPFTKRTVDYALTKTTPDKLSLGIPLYCWKWQLNGGYKRTKALGQELTKEDAEEAIIDIKGHSESLSSDWYLYLTQSGTVFQTWCDGIDGFQDKVDYAKQKGLRGYTAWAIGQEDKDLWKNI